MKKTSYWLKSLAIITIATIASVNPTTPKIAQAIDDFAIDTQPIEIPVPPPEIAEPEINKPAKNRDVRTPEIFISPSQRNQSERPISSESQSIFVPPPETNKAGLCAEFLEPAIQAIIDRPSLRRAKWGILVESLDDKKIFYSHNANQHLIPASNIKLLTTAAALQTLDSGTSIGAKSLTEWIRVTNLRSRNDYAEKLLRHIGGSQIAKQALTRLGVNPGGYRLADGSGLSRRNLATPNALVEIIRAMHFTSESNIFQASLPVAGVSGTLRNRLRNTTAVGKVHAKTGTLRGVRALSGYIKHPDYDTLVFSILVNQPNQSGQTLVRAIDDIVVSLSQLTPCE